MLEKAIRRIPFTETKGPYRVPFESTEWEAKFLTTTTLILLGVKSYGTMDSVTHAVNGGQAQPLLTHSAQSVKRKYKITDIGTRPALSREGLNISNGANIICQWLFLRMFLCNLHWFCTSDRLCGMCLLHGRSVPKRG